MPQCSGYGPLQDAPEYAFIRVMCIGRINQALILRAFEHGADGVILLECKDEDCRYGPGPEVGPFQRGEGAQASPPFWASVSHDWSSEALGRTEGPNWSKPCGTFRSRCKPWVPTRPIPLSNGSPREL